MNAAIAASERVILSALSHHHGQSVLLVKNVAIAMSSPARKLMMPKVAQVRALSSTSTRPFAESASESSSTFREQTLPPELDEDSRIFGYAVVVTLIGANALAIWCESHDEKSVLRTLATANKKVPHVPVDDAEGAESFQTAQPKKRKTRVIHFNWPSK